MGKTLSAYFSGWDKNEIAQFYIHSEIPTSKVCGNFFRITDKDAIKSIFTRRAGTILTTKDVEPDLKTSRTDHGTMAKIYQKGRERTPFIYLARNLIWRLAGWKNKKFRKWIDEFDPEVVFLASGDYSFMYRIARYVAKRKNIPCVLSCMDDYYFNNRNEGKFLGSLLHKRFMKQVKKTMNVSQAILTICDKMTKDYSEFFGKPCFTLHTPTSLSEPLVGEKKVKISYLGNLGYSRYDQLVDIGKALKQIDNPSVPKFIDVYSAESRPKILEKLTEENGIKFHGKINGEQVKQVMAESTAVVHTEAFKENTIKSVKYSVSTKIADSLACGTCIFAYGPDNIASIQYLFDNDVAEIATKKEQLVQALEHLFVDSEQRTAKIEKALKLAKENHDGKKNVELIKNVLTFSMEQKKNSRD
ncbi:MAG: hypothetical protein IKB98_02650 [Clostridia bacterium]|nr:hypothetical protein [Clostridia bacterium]